MAREETILKGQTVDFIGMLAGMLCATHCLLSVSAPILIGFLGLGSLFSHTSEIMFILFGVTTAVLTMLFGTSGPVAYKVRIILLLGILALLFSQYLELTSGHHEDHHQVSSTMSEHTEPVAHHHEIIPLKPAHKDHVIHSVHDEKGHEEEHSALPIFMSVCGGLFIILGHFYNLRSQRVIAGI